MKTFTPSTACLYAGWLAYPRAVGTPGEKASRQQISNQLTGFGLQVEEQPFVFSTFPETCLRIEILTSLALILGVLALSLFQPEFVPIPALLFVLFLTFTARLNRAARRRALASSPEKSASCWSRLRHILGQKVTAANLIAEFPHQQENPGTPGLILVAHADAKSQRVSLVTRLILFTISLGGSLLCAGLALLGLLIPPLTRLSGWTAVVALFTSLPLLFMGFGNHSPGAIDNASGVGLLLHLAEVLAAQPDLSQKLKVILLISGAEEKGGLGVQAYIRQNKAPLREQASAGGLYVMNFDGIGVKGRLCLVDSPRRTRPASSFSLTGLIRDSCAQSGIKLHRIILPGALLDHIPFAEGGFAAASLVTIGKNSRHIHTPDDTADKLDPRGFDQAGRVALEVIQRLAAR